MVEKLDTQLQIKLLTVYKKRGFPFELGVTGVSMKPLLLEGDRVTISPKENCSVGDVVVFVYEEVPLIHRLLEIKGELFLCKGDNALRIEKIQKDEIIGKVISARRDGKDFDIQLNNKQLFITRAVNKLFFMCRLDPIKTRSHRLYKMYKKIMMGNGDVLMYVKNENMEFIEADQSTTAVFDPESGDTHVLDEAGTDIVNILAIPHDFDSLTAKLCEIYEAESADLSEDVQAFLNEAVEKGFVIKL